jgi:phosphohistidine swiveling domain-containing protein
MSLELMSTLKDRHWKSIWVGDWLHLDCSDWGREYTSLPFLGGEPFVERVCFVFRDGKVNAWAAEEELMRFSRRIQALPDDQNSPRALAEGMKAATDDALLFFQLNADPEPSMELYGAYQTVIRGYTDFSWRVKYYYESNPSSANIETLRLFESARTYGEPVFTESVVFIRSFARKLGAHLGIPQHLACCLFDTELALACGGVLPVPLRELESRFTQSAFVWEHGNSAFLLGNAAGDVDALLRAVPTAISQGLHGSIAFRGRVKGRARVILDPSLQTDFVEGDILVTGMTRPEYLHLFRMAGAVVTDAGGVLSHAAITARELKKPCVIGTKVATQVLKDGDLVEVDAEKGVVRVVERATV